MTIIDVFQNDVLYDINFTLRDANDDVIDITGAALLFKAQKERATSLKFGSPMSIVVGTAGTCKYNVASGQFDSPGKYYSEIEITFVGGKVVTLGDIIVNVKPELPRTV